MDVLLWILQAALALLYLAGGAYKASDAGGLAARFPAVPRAGWRSLGALEVLGGALLVAPAFAALPPSLAPLAAGVLALETLGLAALYGARSRSLVAANPLPWALAMGLLAGVLAWGRWVV
jgi:hypothetical protein